jgi:hypothetical protein
MTCSDSRGTLVIGELPKREMVTMVSSMSTAELLLGRRDSSIEGAEARRLVQGALAGNFFERTHGRWLRPRRRGSKKSDR